MKMSQKKIASPDRVGRFAGKRADGRDAGSTLADVRLVNPKKGPTSVSLAKIRKAVRHFHDAQKSK
jgi:hypothetical protein